MDGAARFSLSVISALGGEMEDKTGTDSLARNDWFSKEDKGGKVLCFYHVYSVISFFHWFFTTGPTPRSVHGCDTSP